MSIIRSYKLYINIKNAFIYTNVFVVSKFFLYVSAFCIAFSNCFCNVATSFSNVFVRAVNE